jgi:hypothetical protein
LAERRIVDANHAFPLVIPGQGIGAAAEHAPIVYSFWASHRFVALFLTCWAIP